jgi:SET domain
LCVVALPEKEKRVLLANAFVHLLTALFLLSLFADGNEWFVTRPQLGPIPLEDDLESSSALLKKYTILQETLSKSNISKKIVSDVWATFVKNTTFTDSRVLKGAFRHDNENELEILQEQYKSNMTAARIDGSRRSLDWLRQYGTCGDHIVAGPSRLPQAGMGALARRNLPAGTVVAQLPMIHVTNRTRLDMYQLSVTAENAWVPVNDTVIGHQLLLNYCFGHAESTLLLCPYGPMVNYVNHNQSAANVVLRWGRAETGNHMPALLNGTVQALQESDARAKLAMEMIAVRDIAEGEEILLDYGDEWEAAWNAHVANWKPVADSAAYRSAAQWQGDKTTRLRTVFEELEGKTYPDNIELQCDSALHTDSFECKEQYQEGNLETYLWHNDAAWWPCTVLRYRVGEAGDFLYTVHMFEKAAGGGISNSVLVKDVPRLAFHFVDRPYTSDAFLPNAFRHDIRIPDSIFPQAWRNLRNTE